MENMHALSQILLFPILGALIIALTPKEKRTQSGRLPWGQCHIPLS